MIKSRDVTDKVEFNSNDIDGECLPITKCICGTRFSSWEFFINTYDDIIWSKCPNCGATFYFETGTRIYQVMDD